MQKKSPADQLVQLAVCLASCCRNSAEQASINKLQMTQVFVARRRHDKYHSPQYCIFWSGCNTFKALLGYLKCKYKITLY